MEAFLTVTWWLGKAFWKLGTLRQALSKRLLGGGKYIPIKKMGIYSSDVNAFVVRISSSDFSRGLALLARRMSGPSRCLSDSNEEGRRRGGGGGEEVSSPLDQLSTSSDQSAHLHLFRRKKKGRRSTTRQKIICEGREGERGGCVFTKLVSKSAVADMDGGGGGILLLHH